MVRKRYRLSSLTGIYVLKNLYLLFYRDFVNERSTKLTESYPNIAVYVTERPDRHPRIIANYCKFMHPNFLLRKTNNQGIPSRGELRPTIWSCLSSISEFIFLKNQFLKNE